MCNRELSLLTKPRLYKSSSGSVLLAAARDAGLSMLKTQMHDQKIRVKNIKTASFQKSFIV